MYACSPNVSYLVEYSRTYDHIPQLEQFLLALLLLPLVVQLYPAL